MKELTSSGGNTVRFETYIILFRIIGDSEIYVSREQTLDEGNGLH